MRDIAILAMHLACTLIRLSPRGLRSVVAETILVKHQLLVINRARQSTSARAGLGRTLSAKTPPVEDPARAPRLAASIPRRISQAGFPELIKASFPTVERSP